MHYVTKYNIATIWLVQIATKAIKQHFIHIRPNGIISAPILIAMDLNDMPNATTQTNKVLPPLLRFPQHTELLWVREWR